MVPDWEREPVELIVLIKAAPETGQKHGETVCVAGVDRRGRWRRLYPVPWRDLKPWQRFGRWDIIKAKWRRPTDDDRAESCRIEHRTLEIVGQVPPRERPALANRAVVADIDQEYEAGRTLALIRPERPRFRITKLDATELMKEQRRRDQLVGQADLFASTILTPHVAPYAFTYDFEHARMYRSYRCLDWELEATFFKWRDYYGEERALADIRRMWGETMPTAGIVFAMGTHRVRFFKTWILTGIIRADNLGQGALAF